MGYSKLTDIIIQNFKSIEKAHIKAGEGVTTFKGGNGTGKTTILEALQIALTDNKPGRQHTCIKHHKDYFRIHLKFDDGVEIIKDKYLNGGSLYEMYKDGKCLYTNRTGKKITAIKGVPDIIKEYVGIPTFEKRVINFQDSNQPLLLVDTKPGENYKMLGKASDDGSLPKSLEILTANKKEVSAKIQNAEEHIRFYEHTKRDIATVTQPLLDKIKEADKGMDALEEEIVCVESLRNLIEDVRDARELLQAPIPKVENFYESESIQEIIDLCNIINQPQAARLSKVQGYDELGSISNILDLIELVNDSKMFKSPAKVDTSELESIDNLIHIMQEIQAIQKYSVELKAEKEALQQEIADSDMELVNAGFKWVKCPHCGNSHIISIFED